MRQQYHLGRFDGPPIALRIEHGGGNSGIELDVAAKIETIGDVINVFQYLRLGAVAFGPMPFLLQVTGKGIRVLQAFKITTTTRVTIPVPGPSDVTPCFKCSDRQS